MREIIVFTCKLELRPNIIPRIRPIAWKIPKYSLYKRQHEPFTQRTRIRLMEHPFKEKDFVKCFDNAKTMSLDESVVQFRLYEQLQ